MNSMNASPKVSIIIPCWNAEKYIQEALASAVGQSYQNKEIIVVNDGSTDRTEEILSSFHDILVIDQENAGACAARNKGLEVATGDYIKFLDSDDVLEERCIEEQVVNLKKLSGNEIGFGTRRSIKNNKIIELMPWQKINESPSLHDLVLTVIATSLPLYPRSALNMVSGFDTRLKSRQEWNLNIRLKISGYNFMGDNTLCYRHRAHGLPHRISNRSPQPSEEYSNIVNAIEPLNEIEDVEIRKILAFKIWNVGRWYAIKQPKWSNNFFHLARTYSEKEFAVYLPKRYVFLEKIFNPMVAEIIERGLRLLKSNG